MANERILIVEDDAEIAEVLAAYLHRDGYLTTVCPDGREAMKVFAQWQPDLVLLDYMLPHVGGSEILAAIRRVGDVPVIMVTAVEGEVEKLGALLYGADDYVVKPFNPKEVVARVQVVLKRSRGSQRNAQPRLACGTLEIDLEAVMARVVGNEVPLDLTITEFKLLATLMRQPRKAFSRSELLEASLPESDALERVVDTHVHNLRKKLEEQGVRGIPLAVRGVGYRLGDPG
ncbi:MULTISPECIES: response regulator transcription factor [unclassified Variovorax]|uniref:response regulator transcription factor n=1 Tax=unclassified Variovorax TaxID=663243 RepID=UPI003F45B92B